MTFRGIGPGKVMVPKLAPFGYLDASETEVGIVPGNYAVLFGRDVNAHDLTYPAGPALFGEGIEHGEFHFAVQHSAAHKPKIQLNGFVNYASN